MRLVFLNPQIDDFLGCPPHFKLVGRRALAKYHAILRGEIEAKGVAYAVINGQTSCFLPQQVLTILPLAIRRIIAFIEFKLWVHINSLAGQVKLVGSEDIGPKDVLFGFSYKSAVNDFQITKDTCARFSRVVFHLSHYFIWTEKKSQNLQQIANVELAGDSDLTGNEYFRSFFGWYENRFLVLPFGVGARFKNQAMERNGKCVATGTFHDLRLEKPSSAYADFISVSGEYSYQPIRREIYNARDVLVDQITCLTSPFRSGTTRPFLAQLFGKLDVKQASYFRIDIVREYNKHKYAVVGEEISGFPALGSFEAMLCGAVVFGQKKHMKGLGLVPGKHFIDYDGTLEGLLGKMRSHAGRDLESISRAGESLIRANYSATTIYETWQRALLDKMPGDSSDLFKIKEC